MTVDRIDFDNSATARIDLRALEAMLPCYQTKYGNASILHTFGMEALEVIESAREKTAKAIGASPEEIFFTSGGSEGDGLDYGGAHVIEDLVSNRAVELRAIAYGTDCYPRKEIETSVSLKTLNQAHLFNPRNMYHNLACEHRICLRIATTTRA